MEVGTLVGYHQLEVAFLQHPLAIIAHEGEVVCLQVEGDGLGLAWLQLHLVEGTEAATIWHHTGDQVASRPKSTVGL